MLSESTLMKVSEFVKEKVLGNNEDLSVQRSSKGSARSSFGASGSSAETACQSIKCWTAVLVLTATKNETTLDDKSLQFYCDELLEVLFGSLEARGKALGCLNFVTEQVIFKTIFNLFVYHVPNSLFYDRKRR
jgi:hypothetical protein